MGVDSVHGAMALAVWMKLLKQESRNALSTRPEMCTSSQIRGVRTALGPDLTTTRSPLSAATWALSAFSAFSAFSNTGSGPAWSDVQATTMPNWLGAGRVGERSLDFLRHPARLPGLPLSPRNVERTIVGHLVPAWPPGQPLCPGIVCSRRSTASSGSRRNGNGASAGGTRPSSCPVWPAPVFLHSPSFLTGCSSR